MYDELLEYTTTSSVGEICVYYIGHPYIGLTLVSKCSETLVRFSGHAKAIYS